MKTREDKYMKNLCIGFICVLLFISNASSASEQKATTAHVAFAYNQYYLDCGTFDLPFHLINGYILIPAKVNNTMGKFLFDTATEFPFFFNRHYLSLQKDKFLGKGKAASGQILELYIQNEAITSLQLDGDVHFEELKNLPHADFSFLEVGITPDFLGTMGYGFVHNYAFLINYDHQNITFYPLNRPLPAQLTEAKNIIATMHYTPTGAYGKMPQIPLQIAQHRLSGFMDTGNLGTLELTPELRDQLIREGKLHIETGSHLSATYAPHIRATLKGLHYQGIPLDTVYNLHFTVGKENRVGMGYQFLRNYQTLWNYQQQTVTLLKR
jgi:hypothetical protein